MEEEEEDEDDDEDEDDEEEEEDVGETGMISTAPSSASTGQEYSPLSSPTDEIPQWIVDANKEVEKSKKLRSNKKKKKLTDDWRFWAACIATAGFASALWNVYQVTGGFGSGDGAFGGGPERPELII